MRKVQLILVPYHAGEADVRVGKGPGRLMADGLDEALRRAGLAISTATIPPVSEFEGEIGRSFELKRRVATAVAGAMEEGAFPIVLAGNCNISVGARAGTGAGEAGLIWFDAHPDFDTPDEHASGYFDGMGVATIAGQCWHKLAQSVPGFQPLALERLVYCGIRDFEAGQAEKVVAAGIAAVPGSTSRPVDFAAELDDLLQRAPFDRVMIHLDLDCLDTSVGRANEYAVAGGLSVEQLEACLSAVCRRATPLALTIASFNPDLVGAEAISAAGVRAAVTVATGCTSYCND